MTGFPARYHPNFPDFGSAWHADWSVTNPSWIAASVANHQDGKIVGSGYSADGGLNWTEWPTMPLGAVLGTTTFGFGSVHVGVPGTVLWVGAYSHGIQRTTDYGVTWQTVDFGGITSLGNKVNGKPYFVYRAPMASEKTAANASTFYVHVGGVGIYRSTDNGATWTQRSNNGPFGGVDWNWHEILMTVPDHPGHLFLTPGPLGNKLAPVLTSPFYRSTDGGTTWTQVPNVNSVRGFDFGKAAPGQPYPAIYIMGVVSGVTGMYRSIDNCATWTLLSQQPYDSVANLWKVAASKDVYGLHWLTSPGGGFLRGELV